MSNPKVFPFFRLPRELRDEIYKDVEGRTTRINIKLFKSSSKHALQAHGVSVCKAKFYSHPQGYLLLISKTFRAEYEEEAWQHARLELTKPEQDQFPTVALSDLNASEGLLKSLSKILEISTRISPPNVTRWSLLFPRKLHQRGYKK